MTPFYVFYSGEENRSLPEYLLPDAIFMLTYWLHGKGRASKRFRRIVRARRRERREQSFMRKSHTRDPKRKRKDQDQ